MRLEQQLEELAKLGLHLEPGVGIEEILKEVDRDVLEDPPFDVLLTALGAQQEPYDKPVCSGALGFDTECIYDTGAYVTIVKDLLRLAGKPEDHFQDLEDSIDFDARKAWLKYRLPSGELQRWDIEVHDDWADMMVVDDVMADIEEGGRHFYSKPNGQAMTLFYLDDDTAERLEELAPGYIGRVIPDEEDYEQQPE